MPERMSNFAPLIGKRDIMEPQDPIIPSPTPHDSAPALSQTDQPLLPADEYEASTGEPLALTLDLDTWRPGADLVEMYARLEQEVIDAVGKERDYIRRIRQEVFPRLRHRPE